MGESLPQQRAQTGSGSETLSKCLESELRHSSGSAIETTFAKTHYEIGAYLSEISTTRGKDRLQHDGLSAAHSATVGICKQVKFMNILLHPTPRFHSLPPQHCCHAISSPKRALLEFPHQTNSSKDINPIERYWMVAVASAMPCQYPCPVSVSIDIRKFPLAPSPERTQFSYGRVVPC